MNRLMLFCLLALFAASSALECGKRFHDQHLDKLQQWIVGGVTALEGGYPYQVSFEYNDPDLSGYKRHVCGATIVSSKWVTIAAHCIFAGLNGNTYHVVVGHQNLLKFGSKTKRHEVEKVIIHPKWTGPTYDNQWSNDIALVEVKDPIEFNEFVQPACLPDDVAQNPASLLSLYAPGTPALISGWGKIDAKSPHDQRPGKGSPILRAASVPLIDWKECKNASPLHRNYVTETMVCAGYKEGGVDSCQGDSGGPLVEIVNGIATPIGIVSWGPGCAWPNMPGMYTNVSYELEWIRQYIK